MKALLATSLAILIASVLGAAATPAWSQTDAPPASHSHDEAAAPQHGDQGASAPRGTTGQRRDSNYPSPGTPAGGTYTPTGRGGAPNPGAPGAHPQ
ncbi:hypothetical protein [Paraburkholderia acidipaludis]|uniref:hypothetical protein n=1 Tax=Paraburkholderia acidipaludis TaxID=660537 RepID=UPI0012EB0670|nr:hypothetical protein [Paraburkholderia acidipaludis]